MNRHDKWKSRQEAMSDFEHEYKDSYPIKGYLNGCPKVDNITINIDEALFYRDDKELSFDEAIKINSELSDVENSIFFIKVFGMFVPVEEFKDVYDHFDINKANINDLIKTK